MVSLSVKRFTAWLQPLRLARVLSARFEILLGLGVVAGAAILAVPLDTLSAEQTRNRLAWIIDGGLIQFEAYLSRLVDHTEGTATTAALQVEKKAQELDDLWKQQVQEGKDLSFLLVLDNDGRILNGHTQVVVDPQKVERLVDLPPTESAREIRYIPAEVSAKRYQLHWRAAAIRPDAALDLRILKDAGRLAKPLAGVEAMPRSQVEALGLGNQLGARSSSTLVAMAVRPVKKDGRTLLVAAGTLLEGYPTLVDELVLQIGLPVASIFSPMGRISTTLAQQDGRRLIASELPAQARETVLQAAQSTVGVERVGLHEYFLGWHPIYDHAIASGPGQPVGILEVGLPKSHLERMIWRTRWTALGTAASLLPMPLLLGIYWMRRWRRAERERELVLLSVADGVIGTDLEGRIVFANQTAATLLGRSIRELKAAFLGDVFPLVAFRQHSLIDLALAAGANQTHIALVRRGREQSTAFEYALAPVRDGERLRGTVLTFRDIAERLAADHKRQEVLVLAERTRLAAEVHDSVMNAITGTVWQLEAVKEMIPTAHQAHECLDLALQSAREGQNQLRGALIQLRKEIDEQGSTLPANLAALARQAERTKKLRVCFDLDGEPFDLPPHVTNQLVRIAAEAITNTLKHAKAVTLKVRLAFRAGEIAMSIADDGIGFDPATPRVLGSIGLLSMRERAQRIGACLQVQSAPGGGTTVHVTLPMLLP